MIEPTTITIDEEEYLLVRKDMFMYKELVENFYFAIDNSPKEWLITKELATVFKDADRKLFK